MLRISGFPPFGLWGLGYQPWWRRSLVSKPKWSKLQGLLSRLICQVSCSGAYDTHGDLQFSVKMFINK